MYHSVPYSSFLILDITCTILYPTHPSRYTISRVPYHTLLNLPDTQSYLYHSNTLLILRPRYTILFVPFYTLLILPDTQSYLYPSIPYSSFLINNLTCTILYSTYPSNTLYYLYHSIPYSSFQIHNITCTLPYPIHPSWYTVLSVPFHTLLILPDTQSYLYHSIPYSSFLIHNLTRTLSIHYPSFQIHNLTRTLPYPTHPSWYTTLLFLPP